MTPGLRSTLQGCAATLLTALGAITIHAESFSAVGQCRDGVPNGAYELYSLDGRLRVVGAFAQGRKTGTFIFWTSGGARIAVIPYDADAKTGTLARWYIATDGRSEAGHRLEAPHADDRLHGIKRTWYRNGAPRSELRYEHGVLIEARAWSQTSTPLPDADARALAARDAETDRRFYATLEATVRDHPPRCN